MSQLTQPSFADVASARMPKAIGLGVFAAFGLNLLFDPSTQLLFTSLIVGVIVGGAMGFVWSAMASDLDVLER